MHAMPIWRTLSHFIQVPSAPLPCWLMREVEYSNVVNPIMNYASPILVYQWVNLNDIVFFFIVFTTLSSYDLGELSIDLSNHGF